MGGRLLLERMVPSVAQEDDLSIFYLGRRLELVRLRAITVSGTALTPPKDVVQREKRIKTVLETQELDLYVPIRSWKVYISHYTSKSIEVYVYEMNEDAEEGPGRKNLPTECPLLTYGIKLGR